MSLKRYSAVVGALSLILASPTAYAWDPQENPVSALKQAPYGVDVRDFTGITSGGATSPSDNANIECNEGEKCAVKRELKPVDTYNGTNRGANHYGTMIGLAAGMNSEFHTKQLIDNYVQGKLTLALTTLALTEPSLFSGATKGWELISLDVGNRIASETAFFSQLDVMPEVKEQLGANHVMCIKHYQEQNMNWMEAQTLCINDTADKNSLGSGKLQFNDLGAGGPGESFAFIPELDRATTGDPNAAPGGGGSSSSGGQPSVARLSDYITGALIRGTGGKAKNGVGGDPSKEKGEELKDAFIQLFGDEEYTIRAKDKNKIGTVELKYNRIEPRVSYDEIYNKKVEDTYVALQQTLFRYCQWLKGGGGTGPAAGSHQIDVFTQDAPVQEPAYDLWTSKNGLGFQTTMGEDAMKKLSMVPGYTFSAVVGEALYAHYENNTLAPSGRSSVNICSRLSTHYDWDSVKNSPTNGGSIGRRYLNYAKRIAAGQTLYHYITVAAHAQASAVNKGAPGFVNDRFDARLIAAVRVDDPRRAYQGNLEDFIRELGVVLDDTHIKSGNSMRNVKGASQKGSGDTATVSPADAAP